MDLTQTAGYVPGFPDTLSLRELGGLSAQDGRRVRHGLLYRGSALNGLDEPQRRRIDALGLRFILDLRAEGEASGKRDYVPEGATYLRIAGMYDFEGAPVDFSPEAIQRLTGAVPDASELMRGLYTAMMFGNPAVHALVERFAGGLVPLYFHCVAGKDRTGVCAAVLLMLLGVPDEQIVREFLLTNEYRSSIINLPYEQRPAWASEEQRNNWASINSVNEADLRACFAAVDERYATREEYFEEEFGLTIDALEELRARYLE